MVLGAKGHRMAVRAACTEMTAYCRIKENKVYDDQGFDVTPHPLFQLEPGAAQTKQSKIFASQDASGMASVDLLSSISLQTGVTASFMGPFTRSTFGGSVASKSSRSTESISDEIEEHSARRDTAVSLSDILIRREEVREHVTEVDLSKMVDVFLTETDTIWFLDMADMFISMDSEEAESVKLRNEAYAELCKNRAGNDRYVERMMQTFFGAPKSKEVQSEKIHSQDAAVMATAWDLYDSMNEEEALATTKTSEKGSKPASVASSKSNVSRAIEGSMMTSKTDSSGSSSIMDVEHIILARIPDEMPTGAEEILHSEKFLDDLFFMERILMENNFQPKLAVYRQLPVLTDPDFSYGIELKDACTEGLTLSLNRLWSFGCELTKGRNVSSTAWNKKNPDLLAVGYGQFGFKEQKGGLACCWSLKNPTWPERIFNCESGVTSLDFSTSNPNLLAVGMYNGTVAIYNVHNNYSIPVMDSCQSAGKHTCPVWQLKWLDQERCTLGDDKGEMLISVSADGRITRWHMRKGLESTDLMKIKRTVIEKSKKGPQEREKKIEAFIFRRAPGMCFDFHPKEANIYLAGTEEGHIHKCSCSYNEQFLDTYRGHKGPIYRLAWSPFCHDVFLSCSADWSISLWRQDLLRPILSFSSTTTAVFDIMWSPYSAVVFGAVNESRVEIWDLHVSTLEPVVVNVPNPGVMYTSILFAKNTNCVLISDSDGHVSVYEMRNICITKTAQVDELNGIIATTLASQL
ncbi:dynein axonemal intermediate chain 4 isoform X1 [Ambystoma mexicanum]|uniref:dynein axonemal intermediate chain 4 isoform X1 n=1 Tax=Ambystoma mexicanum TaxID=8296 RepID=UPI0037E94724